MTRYKLLVVVLFFITGFTVKSQEASGRVSLVFPSVEQEATSIWRTINDIDFLEKQGYRIHLPEDKIIDSLIIRSKKGIFGNSDFSTIYNLVETKFFHRENYNPAIQKVQNQLKFINNLVEEINASRQHWDWDFNLKDNYSILLTLYGTGGSYNVDEGVITLFTNQKGDFMNYKDPSNTIIHEIVHMGMEHSIVRKYNLPHGLKERLVDTFVYLMFKKELPEYRIQNMGDIKIDNYLKKPEDIGALNSIISKFIN